MQIATAYQAAHLDRKVGHRARHRRWEPNDCSSTAYGVATDRVGRPLQTPSIATYVLDWSEHRSLDSIAAAGDEVGPAMVTASEPTTLLEALNQTASRHRRKRARKSR